MRERFESQTQELAEMINDLDTVSTQTDNETVHEVWSLSGSTSVRTRTDKLIGDADQEVVCIIGDDAVITAKLLNHLQQAYEIGVEIIIGTGTESVREQVQTAVPGAEVFVSELPWLHGSGATTENEVTINRLLMIDRNTILVSSITESRDTKAETEKAVFGRGFENGLVVIARRLMAIGLGPRDDPRFTEE